MRIEECTESAARIITVEDELEGLTKARVELSAQVETLFSALGIIEPPMESAQNECLPSGGDLGSVIKDKLQTERVYVEYLAVSVSDAVRAIRRIGTREKREDKVGRVA